MSSLRQRMTQDLKIRNYSPRTIEIYIGRVAKFSQYFGKSPDRLSIEHIREFQRYLVEDKKCSWAHLNQTVCALRFFYGVCLKRPAIIKYIPYARPPKKLPVVLSRQEVARIFQACGNLKHRTLLMTLYATGLRISEALGLSVTDIDSQRMMIRVQHGKGGKDRYVPLRSSLLEQLRSYWRVYRPPTWLFSGRDPHRPLTPQTAGRICRKVARQAGLTKRVCPHTFRHTFATHHLEAGTDLKTIQIWLGHSSLSTTSVYLHVARKPSARSRSAKDLLAATIAESLMPIGDH